MRMKNLEKLRVGGTRSKMRLSVPVPKTPDGRVYRYSPNADAHPRHFVLGDRIQPVDPDARKQSRMKQKPGLRRKVCPYSGIIADDDEFNHPDDRKAALKVVKHAFEKDAAALFEDMLSGIARKNSGFLTYKRGNRRPPPRPRFGRRDLMRLLICDHCGRDYGVFAIALFCPDCGAPNISLHFAREVDLVGQQVELAKNLGKDQQELAYRLLGNAHEDVLTAFEATLKTLYRHGIADGRPVGNDFQNIEKSQNRFSELDINPFATLSEAELKRLQLNIQKRHVIGHNLGIADTKFTQSANDAKLGETVKLVGTDIREFAVLCQKVVDWLDDWLGGHPPSDTYAEPQVPLQTDATAEGIDTVIENQIGELSPLATAIAEWICHSSPKGLPEPVDADLLSSAFSEIDESQISEAIAELELDGFVTASHAIGLKIPRIRATEDLFLTFDPLVLKSDPLADAIRLCELVLDGRNSVGLAELHAESGLPLRQFNPAISMIVAEVGDGRVSQELGELDYPTRYFALIPEDRVAIRRMLKQLQG